MLATHNFTTYSLQSTLIAHHTHRWPFEGKLWNYIAQSLCIIDILMHVRTPDDNINSKSNGIRQKKHLLAVCVQIALYKNVMTTHLPIERNKVNSLFHAMKITIQYVKSHIRRKIFCFFSTFSFVLILIESRDPNYSFVNYFWMYIWIQKSAKGAKMIVYVWVHVYACASKHMFFLNRDSFRRGLDRCGQSLVSIYDQNRLLLFVLFCAR